MAELLFYRLLYQPLPDRSPAVKSVRPSVAYCADGPGPGLLMRRGRRRPASTGASARRRSNVRPPPTAIHVVVGPHRGGLRVEVSDDGAGGARPAFGLTSIRDRVASVGGELTVRSPAGAGTTIRATF